MKTLYETNNQGIEHITTRTSQKPPKDLQTQKD
jgi:hypothetical protein